MNSGTPPPVPGFLDRLGDRVLLTDPAFGRVEVLRLRPELTTSALFESGVMRRMNQLAGFLHPNCAKSLQVGRLPAPDGRLVVMSEAVDGWRLSEVLEAAGPCGVAFRADAILFLLRQLLDAVAELHQVADGVSQGAISTERLVVTPEPRLVVTESVLGAALRHLPPMSPDRLWRDLRLAVADREAQPFGRRTDLRQIGVVALSLALGRQLRRDEYPTRLAGLLQDWAPAQSGLSEEALGPGLRGWLARVLSLTGDLTPWSVAEARFELERLAESDRRYAFQPTGLTDLLAAVADYYSAADGSPAQVPTAVTRPPAPAPVGESSAADPAPPSEAAPVTETVRAANAAPVADAVPANDLPPAVVAAPTAEVVPAPDVTPVGDALRAALDQWEPAPAPSEPAPEVLQLPSETPGQSVDVPNSVFAAFWDDPAGRQAVSTPLDSPREPRVETPPVSMFAEPFSPAAALVKGPADAVAPLADTIAAERPVAEAARDRALPPATRQPSRPSSPFLGVQDDDLPDGDLSDDGARPTGGRIRLFIGIAAAAVLIIALGGYVLVRPPSISAIADRYLKSPAPVAVPDPARPAPASPSASASVTAASVEPSAAQPAVEEPAAEEPAAAPAESLPLTGTVEVVSPVPLNVFEGGRTVGASGQPIRLPAGRHTLEIRREDLGYEATQVVDVRPGRRQRVEPSLPRGTANLNATPWAEVWIDGNKVGETPIGGVQLTIGPHQVEFHHPELGDQTRTIVVTTGSAALLSVDMKK